MPNGCSICDKLVHELSEFIKRRISILDKLFTIVKKYDEMYLYFLCVNVHVTINVKHILGGI